MNKTDKILIEELKDMVKVMVEQQELLLKELKDIKVEHKKLKEEVELSNFVLNNISVSKPVVN
jgi:ubiquinone biosynthesis protein COQ9